MRDVDRSIGFTDFLVGTFSNDHLLSRFPRGIALAALDADVVGLMEIQNNGNTAAQNLVDALNAREIGRAHV